MTETEIGKFETAPESDGSFDINGKNERKKRIDPVSMLFGKTKNGENGDTAILLSLIILFLNDRKDLKLVLALLYILM